MQKPNDPGKKFINACEATMFPVEKAAELHAFIVSKKTDDKSFFAVVMRVKESLLGDIHAQLVACVWLHYRYSGNRRACQEKISIIHQMCWSIWEQLPPELQNAPIFSKLPAKYNHPLPSAEDIQKLCAPSKYENGGSGPPASPEGQGGPTPDFDFGHEGGNGGSEPPASLEGQGGPTSYFNMFDLNCELPTH